LKQLSAIIISIETYKLNPQVLSISISFSVALWEGGKSCNIRFQSRTLRARCIFNIGSKESKVKAFIKPKS